MHEKKREDTMLTPRKYSEPVQTDLAGGVRSLTMRADWGFK